MMHPVERTIWILIGLTTVYVVAQVVRWAVT